MYFCSTKTSAFTYGIVAGYFSVAAAGVAAADTSSGAAIAGYCAPGYPAALATAMLLA